MINGKINNILHPTLAKGGSNSQTVYYDLQEGETSITYIWTGDSMRICYNIGREVVKLTPILDGIKKTGTVVIPFGVTRVYFICLNTICLKVNDSALIKNKLMFDFPSGNHMYFGIRSTGEVTVEYVKRDGTIQTDKYNNYNGNIRTNERYGAIKVYGDVTYLTLPTDSRNFFPSSDSLVSLNLGGQSKTYNSIQFLDLSLLPCLEILYASYCNIHVLILDNPSLRKISLVGNSWINYLTLDKCPQLEHLEIDFCWRIQSIDITDNPALESLSCSECEFDTIYLHAINESVTRQIAFIMRQITGINERTGTVYVNETDPYYSIIQEAADVTGWQILPIPWLSK